MDIAAKAVRFHALDSQGRTVGVSSGFIRAEGENVFLHTCWHSVTGYDMNDLKVVEPPRRRRLRVSFQGFEQNQQMSKTGGCQEIEVPLYDESEIPPKPLWHQEAAHLPHPDLNAINLRVPFHYDAIKLPLLKELNVSPLQVVSEPAFEYFMVPGEMVHVVGFPYGFSSYGERQPTPIVLTRFVAAKMVDGYYDCQLLDSPGAPGMSGGPVFVERDEGISFAGIYTGNLYPDHVLQGNEKTTALGRITTLSRAHQNFVPHGDPSIREVTRAAPGVGLMRRGVNIPY